MSDRIEPQPRIMEIKLYKGGASKIDGINDVVKLSSNENPLGVPPGAQAAAQRHRARGARDRIIAARPLMRAFGAR